MEQFNLDRVPKQFCENVVVGFSNEFFVMALFSGGTAGVYALTPEHVKRLSQSLEHNLANYEKQFRKIDAKWIPGMPSPIQSSDLFNDEDKGRGKDKKK